MNYFMRNITVVISYAVIILFPAAELFADRVEQADSGVHDTVLRLPLLDVPYNTEHGYSFPSMNQSLMISKDTLQGTHSIVWDATGSGDSYWSIAALVCWDYFLFMLPGGAAWVHEEWHRAVMGQYGISSENDVYKFDLTAETIAVSHVSDSDLAWLKENHNPDMVRLMEAGNEAEVQLSRVLRRESFFTGRHIIYEIPALWLSLVNESFYVMYCSTDDVNSDTDRMNREDGSDVEKRDFTGYDFTAWIYDLNRPGELYSDRGVHPSGVGVDRYIKYSDLTDSEKSYLKMTGYLTLLNFISPQMFGFERFSAEDPVTGEKLYWNFMVLHNLTSFGNDISVNLLLQKRTLNLELALHSYFNEKHYSPGIEGGIHRYPVSLAGKRIYMSTGLLLFMQPRDQEFHTGSREAGVYTEVWADVPIIEDKLEISVGGDVKSDGWVAGNVYLDDALQGRCGVNYLY